MIIEQRLLVLFSSIVLALSLGSGSAFGASLLESYAPGEYDLTVRLDVRQALESPALEPLRQRFIGPSVQLIVDEIYVASGIDLLKDLDEVVLAGFFDDSKKDDGVVMLRGHWDPQSVLDIFRMSEQFETITVDTGTMHGFWSEDDQEMRYLCFPEANVVALGRREPVEKTLACAIQSDDRMWDQPDYRRALKTIPTEALCRVVAVAPSPSPSERAAAAILQDIRAFSLGLDVSDRCEIDMQLAVSDQQTARHWQDVAKGMLAFAQMLDHQPILGDLAERAALQAQHDNLSLALSMSMDEAWQLLATNPKFRWLRHSVN